ncbi:MAG TPA: efflux RND transporter periplasmic adaptor subunit [Chthoniobacteraceae bacterium]|jgi:HlyD family secretion protein|nr:efflux RND transporter periplasmic adaptor subunit [Chthoniobacteraceae bacterium]
MIRWILIALAIAAAVAGWWYFRDHGPEALRYDTAPIARGDLTQVVQATGILNPVLNVQVGSQISGNIQKLYADFNSNVKKGEIVAELDPAIYKAIVHQQEADLASAKAALELAQLNAKRKNDLLQQHAAPQADVDTANATLHQAEATVKMKDANLEKARADLDHCTIYSPIDGTVISRAVDVGQTVAAAMNAPVLFTVANDLKKMQIDSSVAEADVGNVELDQAVDFTVDAFPFRTFHGTVVQVRNAATTVQNVVTYDVVISVANEDLKLKPGMTTTLSIVIAQRENVLKLPNAALRFRPPVEVAATPVPVKGSPTPAPPKGPGGPGGKGRKGGGGPRGERTIYVLKAGAAKPDPVQVKLGISDGITSEILSGLEEGQSVVTGIENPPPVNGMQKSSNPISGGGPRFR